MKTEMLHWSGNLIAVSFTLADLFIRLGLSIRVIMRQRQYGVTLAWLIIILLIPFLGAIIYLFLGENRIGETRAKRAEESLNHYHHWLASLQKISSASCNTYCQEMESIQHQANTLVGIPTMDGNELELIENPVQIMQSIIRDMDNAKSTCHLQFYIWQDGGTTDEVVESLIRAARRGVICRVLVDSIGSKEFLKGKQVKRLRKAGVRVLESLPAGFFKAFFVRIDIRNHRKIVIIDGKIAYTGSQNMVDPKVFKKDSGVGLWIDNMVRVQGPVVEAMAGTFISDWFLETDGNSYQPRSLNEDVQHIRKITDLRHLPPVGNIAIQFVPSGPSFSQEAIHKLLLTTIYSSRKSLVLTTPYFVPDESILTALTSAAQRGVDVRIIIPEKNDSKLVQYASNARYQTMLESGITIKLFTGGLLHAKTITVDDKFSLFGSVNIDMRSVWLNFEATLFIYNQDFTKKLRTVQAGYEANTHTLSLDKVKNKKFFKRFCENAALIISPIL